MYSLKQNVGLVLSNLASQDLQISTYSDSCNYTFLDFLKHKLSAQTTPESTFSGCGVCPSSKAFKSPKRFGSSRRRFESRNLVRWLALRGKKRQEPLVSETQMEKPVLKYLKTPAKGFVSSLDKPV